jgi:hypothetical protein
MHSFPVWQSSPGQQAVPTAPQFMQVRAAPPPGLAQTRLPLQLLPAQQALPFAPQAWQVIAPPPVAAWQEKPVLQALAAAPLQQIPPAEPQVMHMRVVASQRVPEAVQEFPPAVQQFSVRAPQLVPPVILQELVMHVPAPAPQVVPDATQVP